MTKFNASPRISITSKLDGIRSWSLQAIDTCPGSKGADGDLVDACKGCYATTGNYRYPNVIAPRVHNRADWENADWIDAMVQALDADRYFRWFDSGDAYAVELMEKIFQVMQRTPWVKHWMPTRMAKFAKFADILARMQALPNVSVRFSADSVDGTFTAGLHGSVIIPTPADLPAGAVLCQAYENAGKCSGCRACWNKDVQVIAYPAHGVKMQKVIRLKKT